MFDIQLDSFSDAHHANDPALFALEQDLERAILAAALATAPAGAGVGTPTSRDAGDVVMDRAYYQTATEDLEGLWMELFRLQEDINGNGPEQGGELLRVQQQLHRQQVRLNGQQQQLQQLPDSQRLTEQLLEQYLTSIDAERVSRAVTYDESFNTCNSLSDTADANAASPHTTLSRSTVSFRKNKAPLQKLVFKPFSSRRKSRQLQAALSRRAAAARRTAASAAKQQQLAQMLESFSNEELNQALKQALQQQLAQQEHPQYCIEATAAAAESWQQQQQLVLPSQHQDLVLQQWLLQQLQEHEQEQSIAKSESCMLETAWSLESSNQMPQQEQQWVASTAIMQQQQPLTSVQLCCSQIETPDSQKQRQQQARLSFSASAQKYHRREMHRCSKPTHVPISDCVSAAAAGAPATTAVAAASTAVQASAVAVCSSEQGLHTRASLTLQQQQQRQCFPAADLSTHCSTGSSSSASCGSSSNAVTAPPVPAVPSACTFEVLQFEDFLDDAFDLLRDL